MSSNRQADESCMSGSRPLGVPLAELPCEFRPQRWCEPARARTVASLARLTILVEADDDPHELLGARAARALGQTVAALPGQVTSPVSRGTNRLLLEGTPMVRGPADALDLLYTISCPDGHKPASPEPRSWSHGCKPYSEPRSARGETHPGKLTAVGEDTDETMLGLTELEVMGLLARGDGGRYVPRQSLASR